MLTITRRSLIKETLKEHKTVTVSELAKKLNVTRETIRHDLQTLEGEGFLMRTHGGAFIQDSVQNEVSMMVRKTANVTEKTLIAQKAAEFIQDGDSIFIDFSTTCSFICQYIKNKKITVLTNSLFVADSLSESENINLILLGGAYRASEKAFLGSMTMRDLGIFYVDKVFMSARFLSIENGMTDYNETFAELHQFMLKRGNTIYLLADSSKFNKTSFVSISDFRDIDVLITGKPLSKKWSDYLEKNQVHIIDSLE
jgi:DeoR/GlpR family transcriptional regulator of sugar metabolism